MEKIHKIKHRLPERRGTLNMEEDYAIRYFILPGQTTHHTTQHSQIFSVAVRSEASTENTGQMQIPDCLHLATWHYRA